MNVSPETVRVYVRDLVLQANSPRVSLLANNRDSNRIRASTSSRRLRRRTATSPPWATGRNRTGRRRTTFSQAIFLT